MNAPGAALLQRRLLFVTGKGGTGKTTLAAALGVCASRRGIDTVVVELGDEASLPALLAPAGRSLPEGDGRLPVPVEPHLFTLRIEPEVALTEYLELELGVRMLVRLVMGNSGFRRLIGAAPGWRELIALGKLWHLATRSDGERPRYGVLIVDAPASGHGLSLLSVPRVVLDTVRLGPLRRHTDRVQALLTDPARTLAVAVTLLEELPVRETLQLCADLQGLGIAPGPLVANAIEPELDADELESALEALQGLPAPPFPTPLHAPALRACVRSALRRRGLQQRFLKEVESGLGRSALCLPYLPEGVPDRAGIDRVAEHLERELARAEAGA